MRSPWLAACLAVLAVLAVVRPAATEAPPQRIVSTSPSITETLFALGLGDRVVGVSRYCRHPAAARTRTPIGTFLKPDVEAIARLRPDLVLIHSSSDDIEARLDALHLRHVAVERGTLSGVYSRINAIGAAAGVSDRAQALVVDLKGRLEAIRAGVATRPPPKVLLIVGRRGGTLSDIVAVGGGSYLDELIMIAGGVNVLADVRPEYPRIGLETVLRSRPDVVIDTAEMGDTAEERQRNSATNLALWRENALVKAASIRAIHAATTDALVVPGPRVVEAALWLRDRIHPAVGP